MWSKSSSPRATGRGRRILRNSQVAIAASALIALSACGDGDSEAADGSETFEFSVGHHDATGGPRAVQIEDYIAEVDKRSDHEVKAKFYHDAALCPPNEQAVCAGDGRIDITQVLPSYHPAEFPMSTVASLGFFEVPDAMGNALYELWNTDEKVKAEWDEQNLRPLFPTSVGDYTLGSGKELKSFDDLKGMRVRAIGASASALSSIGMETSALAAPEIYESMQRGVIDGWSIPIDYAYTQGYEEVTPYVYDIGMGPALSSMFSMNADTWESLPEDLQATMLEVGEEFGTNGWSDYLIPSIQESCKAAADHLKGVGVLEDGRAEFMEAGLDITTKDWIDNIAGDSIDDPQALADKYRKMLSEWETKLGDDFVTSTEACADSL